MKRKSNEEKELDRLLGELDQLKEMLKELGDNTFKPKFKICMESDEKGKGFTIEVEGNKLSLKIALSELVCELLQDTDLTEKDIMEAVETGLECPEEDEEEE